MRLALLIGCRPKLGLESSFVQLREGNWKLRYEDVKDTILHLIVRSPVTNYEEDTRADSDIPGESNVKVVIVKAGTEPSIKVWAEQCL